MHKLFAHLKYRRLLLLFAVLSACAVLLGCFLSGQDMAVARYVVLLMAFALVCILGVDGARFLHRRNYAALLLTEAETLTKRLPEPADALEADYFAALAALSERLEREQAEAMRMQSEQLDYYTLWVHQIKTPIAAMRLLLEGEDTARSRALLQELFKTEQYADLALRYAKLTDIAGDLVIEPCDLAAVVRESVKKYALLFICGKLTVTVAPIEKTVTSDRRWLQFILEQALSNAVKYTKSGGVTVTMAGDTLTVSDTGVGIRAEDLPRIFEKGYTGFNGRVDARASGIGLYLAKRAADALHLCLSVASEPGIGTRFSVTFPPEREMLAE